MTFQRYNITIVAASDFSELKMTGGGAMLILITRTTKGKLSSTVFQSLLTPLKKEV